MQAAILLALTWIALSSLVAILVSRKNLLSLWREPVLKHPVLIVESDDWGAGPLEQAALLDRIAAVLASHTNRLGEKPIMTLGLVLSVPDDAQVCAGELTTYRRSSLEDPRFAAVLSAIERGVANRVFALQLHAEEHYWPARLLSAASKDASVKAWLARCESCRTEDLPAALQSRWIDGSGDEIEAAARAEAVHFRRIFGMDPGVAVPPTFIWSETVEAGWAKCGVKVVVTPGRRYETRTATGEPVGAREAILNAERSSAGIMYLVRDRYFEPARGHTAARGLAALAEKTHLGRPALLETHRANFIAGPRDAEIALRELNSLYAAALRSFPRVRFLSTEELAYRMRDGDPELIEQSPLARLRVWLRRLWGTPSLRRLAWLTGMVVPGCVLYLSASLAYRTSR